MSRHILAVIRTVTDWCWPERCAMRGLLHREGRLFYMWSPVGDRREVLHIWPSIFPRLSDNARRWKLWALLGDLAQVLAGLFYVAA